MQHYGVNGYSLHAMNSLSAMYNLHQQAAQQAQHAPDYRPSVHALTLAERLAGKGCGHGPGAWTGRVGGRSGLGEEALEGRDRREGTPGKFPVGGSRRSRSLSNRRGCQFKILVWLPRAPLVASTMLGAGAALCPQMPGEGFISLFTDEDLGRRVGD